jgi:hypothetical protein
VSPNWSKDDVCGDAKRGTNFRAMRPATTLAIALLLAAILIAGVIALMRM